MYMTIMLLTSHAACTNRYLQSTMKKQIVLILALLATCTGIGQTIQVARIVDGDTFKDTNDQTYRLLGINAPEKNEAGGIESISYLDSMILNQQVQIFKDYNKDTIDIYRRHLVYVHKNMQDLNKEMILNGYAKVYTKYPFSRQQEYELAQSMHDSRTAIQKEKPNKPNFKLKYILIGVLSVLLLSIGIYYYYA